MATDTTTMLIFGCILLLHGLLKRCGVRLVTVLNSIPVWWQPTGVAIIVGSADHEPGPWSLGRWRRMIGCIAVAYGVIITVIWCLPQSAPITPESFNYAGVTLAIALVQAADLDHPRTP